MRSILNVLLVVCSFFSASFGMASGLGDIFRQSGGVVVDTERNKSSTVIDAERRKDAIDADAQRQIANLDTLIEENNRRIDEEFEPQLMDARVNLRALERERTEGVISRGEYMNEKQSADNRASNMRNSIMGLKRQNSEYARREKEILMDARRQKQQVDADTRGNVDQQTTRQNSSILDEIIRNLGR